MYISHIEISIHDAELLFQRSIMSLQFVPFSYVFHLLHTITHAHSFLNHRCRPIIQILLVASVKGWTILSHIELCMCTLYLIPLNMVLLMYNYRYVEPLYLSLWDSVKAINKISGYSIRTTYKMIMIGSIQCFHGCWERNNT